MNTAAVWLWGTRIGAVTWDPAGRAGRGLGYFEYDPDFVASGIQVAPLTMPLDEQGSRRVHSFSGLAGEAFLGLPGLLSDSLPDRFGHALIDAWLRAQGRQPGDFDPVERLCYVGERGMGALEYQPATLGVEQAGADLEIAPLVELASQALSDRRAFETHLAGGESSSQAVLEMLRIGTSAGGARAKAVIAWNEATGQVRSGQVAADSGFEYWILKFDGVDGNADRGLTQPLGFGRIEYAYAQMARAAGIEMERTRLLEEGGRAHFMTRRFDRMPSKGGVQKRHMQTLGAVAHLDYNLVGAHSYEAALGVCRRLGLPMAQREQLFLRAVFNIVARNQDDHVKNTAFLMDKRGVWSLSPAYDVTHAYRPDSKWTALHAMTLAGKRDGFEQGDLVACARAASLAKRLPNQALEQVLEAVRRWPEFADQAGVSEERATEVGATHRLDWS